MGQISARNAKVRINGGVFCAKKWTFTPKSEALDVTCFDSGSVTQASATQQSGVYGTYVPSVNDADVEIEADYDYNTSPALMSVIRQGSFVSCRLYLNDTTGSYVDIPSLYISEAPLGAAVRETVTFKITGKASGVYSLPAL